MPMEERFLVLKIYSPPVPQVLRRLLAQLEPHLGERCSEVSPPIKEVNAKGEASSDPKRAASKI